MIILDKNLATRESARILFKSLYSKKDNIIDLKEVIFVSRSFTNELLNLEKENNFYIKKINMNKDVKYMFSIADKVLDSDILSKNKYSTISLKDIENLI